MRRYRTYPGVSTAAAWSVNVSPRCHMRALRQARQPHRCNAAHGKANGDGPGAGTGGGSWLPSFRMMMAIACGALFWEAVSSQKDHVWRWVQERLWTRLEVRSATNRALYDALLFWCASQKESEHAANLMIASEDITANGDLVSDRTSPMFAPGYGRHRYRCHLPPAGDNKKASLGTDASTLTTVVMTRDIDDTTRHKTPRGNAKSVDEILTFCAVGADGRARLAALVAEAERMYIAESNKRIRVHHNDGGYWSFLCWRHRRPRASMELSDRQCRVLDDAERFLGAQGVYASLGVPWRRGYLLHGPPGTGKSSFIALLAGALHTQVYLLSLKDSNLTDAMLHTAINSVPPHSVLVLEDIDSLSLDSVEGGQRGGCSWSGVLNALDGIAASEGRILFLTANRPQVLPPALLRPGRIDDAVPFERLSTAAAVRMENRFRSILSRGADGGTDGCAPEPGWKHQAAVADAALRTPAEVQNGLLNALLYDQVPVIPTHS